MNLSLKLKDGPSNFVSIPKNFFLTDMLELNSDNNTRIVLELENLSQKLICEVGKDY